MYTPFAFVLYCKLTASRLAYKIWLPPAPPWPLVRIHICTHVGCYMRNKAGEGAFLPFHMKMNLSRKEGKKPPSQRRRWKLAQCIVQYILVQKQAGESKNTPFPQNSVIIGKLFFKDMAAGFIWRFWAGGQVLKTWEGEGEAMSEIRKLNLDTKILAESLARLARKERQSGSFGIAPPSCPDTFPSPKGYPTRARQNFGRVS